MSTEKKLTAVEWLVENTPLCKNDFYLEQINQAKEKEKQQLYDFYNIGFTNGVNNENKSSCLEFEKEYRKLFEPTKETTKEEIPTLNDGVLMLVSQDKVIWYSELVFGIKKGYFIAWDDLEYNSISLWKYTKLLPTKEEQLTAILGSSEKVSEIMELFKNE